MLHNITNDYEHPPIERKQIGNTRNLPSVNPKTYASYK